MRERTRCDTRRYCSSRVGLGYSHTRRHVENSTTDKLMRKARFVHREQSKSGGVLVSQNSVNHQSPNDSKSRYCVSDIGEGKKKKKTRCFSGKGETKSRTVVKPREPKTSVRQSRSGRTDKKLEGSFGRRSSGRVYNFD